ncbi:hypothetical protein KR222_009288, partial [Zaprionus bogoriensis]
MLAVGVVCLFISSCITMSVPFLLGKVIDVVFNMDQMPEESLEKLRSLSAGLFVLFLIGGLANFSRVYLFGAASLRIVRRLRSNLYQSMLLQEISWFDTKGSGELVNRLSNDTFFVGSSLSQNVSDGLRSLAMICVGSSMMIYTSPKLALVSALVVPGVASLAIFYGRYVRSITRQELDKYAELMKHAEERLANAKTVKTFSREQREVEDFNTMLDSAMVIGFKETKARSMFFGSTGFTGNVIIIAVLYYGGTLVTQNELTMGAMTAFMLYAGYVAISMNGISNFYSQLNKGLGASDRLWEILDRPLTIPYNSGIVPTQPPVGELEFRNMNFTYPTRDELPLFTDFNLKLRPHQMTAVVGRSGSGKSTLAMLLLRLFDPMSGGIYLDGVDYRDLNPRWLRDQIGSVGQEPVLFSGTIRDNILYGIDPNIPDVEQRLEQALRDAHLYELIEKLPNGLETMVGQRGMLLSGGQKQRVAIARALIKNPTILVLDEATSALDSVSEQLVQDALERLIEGRTVMTISHRLSTIYQADKIAVLEKGRVVEEGKYDELMRIENGVFRELALKQNIGEGL